MIAPRSEKLSASRMGEEMGKGNWGQSFLQKPISCLKQQSCRDRWMEEEEGSHGRRTPGASKRGKVGERARDGYRDSFCMRLRLGRFCFFSFFFKGGAAEERNGPLPKRAPMMMGHRHETTQSRCPVSSMRLTQALSE